MAALSSAAIIAMFSIIRWELVDNDLNPLGKLNKIFIRDGKLVLRFDAERNHTSPRLLGYYRDEQECDLVFADLSTIAGSFFEVFMSVTI